MLNPSPRELSKLAGINIQQALDILYPDPGPDRGEAEYRIVAEHPYYREGKYE